MQESVDLYEGVRLFRSLRADCRHPPPLRSDRSAKMKLGARLLLAHTSQQGGLEVRGSGRARPGSRQKVNSARAGACRRDYVMVWSGAAQGEYSRYSDSIHVGMIQIRPRTKYAGA